MVVKFYSSKELNQLKQVKKPSRISNKLQSISSRHVPTKTGRNYILIYNAKMCISEFLSIHDWDHIFNRYERCPKKSGSSPFYFFPSLDHQTR